jgi:hypothetical protein
VRDHGAMSGEEDPKRGLKGAWREENRECFFGGLNQGKQRIGLFPYFRAGSTNLVATVAKQLRSRFR